MHYDVYLFNPSVICRPLFEKFYYQNLDLTHHKHVLLGLPISMFSTVGRQQISKVVNSI